MSDELIRRVIGCIASTQHISPENILAESTFEELGIDSLDGINILFALENEFDVSIPDNAAQTVRTVGDMAEGVQRLLDEKASGASQSGS